MAYAASVAPNQAPYEQMGASLLSQQPVTSDRRYDPEEGWQQTFSALESRMTGLRTWRYTWWQHWARLAEFFMPRRYHWVITANRMARGSAINDQIIDSTGTLAVQTCASGLWTGLTSPSRPWFALDIGLPWVQLDAESQAWLEDTQERIYTVLAQSNFYTIMAQAFQDVTVFGTAPVIIYEDFEDVIRCYLPCAGEYFLAASSRLDVDTLYREFTLTVSQIVEMFQIDNCPEQIVKIWNDGAGNLDTEFVVAHSIEPNIGIAKRGGRGGDKVQVVPGRFAYREVYWLRGMTTARPLSKRGFNGRPFMVARWSTVSNDAYGRSPCMDALGDTKQIQQETRRKAEFIEKGVRPPMGAGPEMKNEPSSITPGAITYTSTQNGAKGFWPLFEPNPAWLPAISTDIKEVADRINRCLFVDTFMAITQMEGVQPRNELELTKRDLERLQVLGPFIQQFENEFAGPTIARLLDILGRRNMLLPKPPSLKDVPLKINYQSIMKLAQQGAEAISMKDFFGLAGNLSSAAKAASVPDPVRTVNLDKALAHYGTLVNFPADCMFPPKEVAIHDAIRTQEMQKAQAQQQGPQQAMAAVTAAKTLSETNMGGPTALNAMLGGGGTPGGPSS